MENSSYEEDQNEENPNLFFFPNRLDLVIFKSKESRSMLKNQTTTYNVRMDTLAYGNCSKRETEIKYIDEP